MGCPSVLQVLDLPFAVPTFKADRTKGLITSEYGQVLYVIPACATAIGTVVTNERPVGEEKKVGIGVENCAAVITFETIQMPTTAGYC